MKHVVTVPSPGESISEVFIGTWLKKTGDLVRKDEILVDLETQKATFELQAEHSGRIEVLFPKAETKVKPGDVIAIIDDSASVGDAPAQAAAVKAASPAESSTPKATVASEPKSSKGKSGLITAEDVLASLQNPAPQLTEVSVPQPNPKVAAMVYHVDTSRGEKRQPATRMRRQIAQNLVAAQHTAAILTTFNEVDMSAVMAYRKKNKEAFQQKHGVSLGMLSFFVLASIRALKEFPLVNATFTGEDIIFRDFVDLSVAVSTEKGLVVPVVRDVQKMTIVDFEKKLGELSERARVGKLSIPEMTGGTFTITNGGVFGSLMSTPILNMPQSGILGLHKIQDRPMVIEGKVEIRPMMYLALSYDHRIIDGKDAVGFLVKIKEGIENLSLIINE